MVTVRAMAVAVATLVPGLAAGQAASFLTTFFVILGLFAIAAGMMLIFLIFVMLAAEDVPSHLDVAIGRYVDRCRWSRLLHRQTKCPAAQDVPLFDSGFRF